MQSSSEVKESLEKAKEYAVLRESILNELRQNIAHNSLLSAEVKSAMQVEIVKLSLSTYIDEKIAIESNELRDSGNTVFQTTTRAETPREQSPSKINHNKTNSESSHLVSTSKPSTQGSRRKLSLNLEPKNINLRISREGDLVGNKKDSPKEKHSPNSKSVQESNKTNSPSRKNSGSPRWLDGSDSSPGRKKSSSGSLSGRKEQLGLSFFDSLPVDKTLLQLYLSKAKPYLKEKGQSVPIITEKTQPDLQAIVVPHRDMKTNKDSGENTVLLLDRGKVEGEGKNKVIKGYDLIHKACLAVKLLTDLVYNLHEKEIVALAKRGWFYGFYALKDEYALTMKLVPGETLLQILYVIDESASRIDINSNYCTARKDIPFDLEFQIILQLMKEVLKLHMKYKLLHRDLKPENIKVYFENDKVKVKLVDFGDAVAIDSKILELCGTVGYTDPEIWDPKQAKPYDKEHDIYSLAVIIFEILSKRNFQQAIKEHKKRVQNEIVTPGMTPQQTQSAMDDVLHPEKIDEHFESQECVTESIHNFILLELKKLAKSMMDTRLRDSSLSEEIKRIEDIEKNAQKLGRKMHAFWDGKEDVENALNKMNNKFNVGLFAPKKEYVIHSAKDAVECFKEMHAASDENNSSLYL